VYVLFEEKTRVPTPVFVNVCAPPKGPLIVNVPEGTETVFKETDPEQVSVVVSDPVKVPVN
jgi:hypothetical protein